MAITAIPTRHCQLTPLGNFRKETVTIPLRHCQLLPLTEFLHDFGTVQIVGRAVRSSVNYNIAAESFVWRSLDGRCTAKNVAAITGAITDSGEGVGTLVVPVDRHERFPSTAWVGDV